MKPQIMRAALRTSQTFARSARKIVGPHQEPARHAANCRTARPASHARRRCLGRAYADKISTRMPLCWVLRNGAEGPFRTFQERILADTIQNIPFRRRYVIYYDVAVTAVTAVTRLKHYKARRATELPLPLLIGQAQSCWAPAASTTRTWRSARCRTRAARGRGPSVRPRRCRTRR